MISLLIVGIITTDVFSAIRLQINVDGNIKYSATEIGAKVFGTCAKNTSTTPGEATYLEFSRGGALLSLMSMKLAVLP